MDNRTIEEVRINEDRLINKIELLKQENQELKEENQELKKQLNDLEKQSAEAINKHVARGIELVNQQKEFIEYLENEIQKQKDYGASFGLFIDRDISEHISEKIETCQDFLSKYKEMMGVDK